MNQPNQPNQSDLVLGQQNPPPINSAVLGGTQGLRQRFESDDLAQKLATLVEASQRGETGIELLNKGLQDKDLRVRMEAYLQLKAIAPSTPYLDRGMPLSVGDRIYAVYESPLCYDDNAYYIESQLSQEFQQDSFLYGCLKDSKGKSFEYVSDVSYTYYEAPKLVTYFFDHATAQERAETVHQSKLRSEAWGLSRIERCDYYEGSNYTSPGITPYSTHVSKINTLLKPWVQDRAIVIEDILQDWEDNEITYEARVLISLERQKQVDLLQEMWTLLEYKKFAFVHEYVIDRPCYLRLQALEA
jgi:hypothetical protein